MSPITRLQSQRISNVISLVLQKAPIQNAQEIPTLMKIIEHDEQQFAIPPQKNDLCAKTENEFVTLLKKSTANINAAESNFLPQCHLLANVSPCFPMKSLKHYDH